MKKAASAQASIHAVVGSDESEVKRAASELAAQLTPPDGGDFGIEVIDGTGDNSEQSASRIRAAVEALQTLPFFRRQTVWLKNSNGSAIRYRPLSGGAGRARGAERGAGCRAATRRDVSA
jgi:DNA polymerase-3 subunit delta